MSSSLYKSCFDGLSMVAVIFAAKPQHPVSQAIVALQIGSLMRHCGNLAHARCWQLSMTPRLLHQVLLLQHQSSAELWNRLASSAGARSCLLMLHDKSSVNSPPKAVTLHSASHIRSNIHALSYVSTLLNGNELSLPRLWVHNLFCYPS